MNVLVFTPYQYDTVPGQRFRIEQWARHLGPLGVRFHFIPFESPALKEVLYTNTHYSKKLTEMMSCLVRRVRDVTTIRSEWDVIYLYRELLPIGPPWLERLLAKKKIPIVYDFDDAIFLPAVSDANRSFQWLKLPQKTGTLCRLSAHVVVGNAYLKEYALRHTARVSVIPTTIDTELYTPKERVDIQGVPIIGWSGSLTTLAHLKIVTRVLRTLRHSHRFRLKVLGSSNFSVDGLDVESRPWSVQAELPELRSFDIGIMPLPHDEWSRGKCGLKALQYMALGIPTIASPVGVNPEIIQDGVNGFLAGSEEEWVEKLSALLSDDDLRRTFAEEGRRTVETWYSARVQASRLLSIVEQLRGRHVSVPSRLPTPSVR